MVRKMTQVSIDNLLVSSGGTEPGIGVFDVFGHSFEPLLTLEQGQSVYAVDITADRTAIAAGTKSGYIIYLRRPDAIEDTIRTERFFMASPILSVKFIGPDTVAASDIYGQIVIWNLQDQAQSKLLDTSQEPVCSLFCINSSLLAGLTIYGNVLIWDLTGPECPIFIKGFPIPAICSLVNVIYFNGCWVWPDHSGSIIIFDAQSQQMEVLKAHIGTLYAICNCDGKLISLGKSDGLLKFWKSGSNQPAKSVYLAGGGVSMSVWKQQRLRCFMINESGCACVFDIDQNDNVSALKVEGSNYRTVLGPDRNYIENRLYDNKNDRIEQLSTEIKSRINSGNFVGIDHLYQQLEQLGSHEIVLWLSAYQAETQNDLYGQINCCHQLYQILDHSERQSISFLSKYIKALVRTYQFKRAVSLFEEYDIAGKLLEEQIGYSELCEQSSILSQHLCIIDQPADSMAILKSYALLDNSTDALLVCNLITLHEIEYLIDYSEFALKYQIYRNQKYPQLPEAFKKDMYWCSDQQFRKLGSIVLGLPDPDMKCIISLETKHNKTKINTVAAIDVQKCLQNNNEFSESALDSKMSSILKYLKNEGSLLSAIKNIAQQYKTMAINAENPY